MSASTTCQICGRPIKTVKKGVISHHGYKRPGDGWQTSSCQGARHLPYEQSCERIKELLPRLRDSAASLGNLLKEMVAAPPETLIYEQYRGPREMPQRIPVERPVGFAPAKALATDWRADKYTRAYVDLHKRRAQMLKATEAQIEYLAERLAAWKPAEVTA